MSISLREIKGLAELLERARETQTATREDAWIGLTQIIAGQRVRVMTVQDYTALLQFESPLLHRKLPTPNELSFFLWALSPEIQAWHERRGWRGWRCLKKLEQWQSHRHGKNVRRTLQLPELEESEAAWHAKAKGVTYELPDSAPFTIAVKQVFAYMDEIFAERPAALKKGGAPSGLCYLTSWFDLMQSEYHLPTQEIWEMKMPVLFARIKAIQMRHNGKVPDFSADRDRILQKIMLGLNRKDFTEEDLKSGLVDLEKFCLN